MYITYSEVKIHYLNILPSFVNLLCLHMLHVICLTYLYILYIYYVYIYIYICIYIYIYNLYFGYTKNAESKSNESGNHIYLGILN